MTRRHVIGIIEAVVLIVTAPIFFSEMCKVGNYNPVILLKATIDNFLNF